MTASYDASGKWVYDNRFETSPPQGKITEIDGVVSSKGFVWISDGDGGYCLASEHGKQPTSIWFQIDSSLPMKSIRVLTDHIKIPGAQGYRDYAIFVGNPDTTVKILLKKGAEDAPEKEIYIYKGDIAFLNGINVTTPLDGITSVLVGFEGDKYIQLRAVRFEVKSIKASESEPVGDISTRPGIPSDDISVQPSGLARDGFIFGINGHPLGGGGIYGEEIGVNLKTQLQLLKELGINWYSFDVFARDPDPEHGWTNTDELDLIVPAAEAAGISLFPLLYPPIEYRPYVSLRERMPLDEIYQRCYEHAKRAATKWRGRIKVWKFLGEADSWTMKGSNHGQELEDFDPKLIEISATILRGMTDGIKSGDPQAKRAILTGGWTHFGFVNWMIKHGVDFDILCWHWYSDCDDFESIRVFRFNLIERLRKYGKPIWIGEFNTRPLATHQPQEEAIDYVSRNMRSLHRMCSRGAEAVFIYQLLDQPSIENSPEAHYGLVKVVREADEAGQTRFKLGERKPIFFAVQQLIKELREEEKSQD